ncbi:hypothetical protein HRbin05_00255 [archaeon HR05]|nr:hypothetical protein HRbin05_00255 [archaeon HR05]
MTNYIMRIANNEEFETSIFSRRAYYTAMRRRWEKGMKILLAKKIEGKGDAFIGYAVVDKALSIDELSMEERDMCRRNGWNTKTVFSRLVRLQPPIPIKYTPVGRWPQKGALLHGAPIGDDDLNSVIELASMKINY